MAKLNALKVKRLVTTGRYGDGGGLWLQVRGADAKSWLFRYRMGGKARQMGLGPEHLVGLGEARELARDAARLVRQAVDPIERRQQERANAAGATMTFRTVAEAYIAAHEAGWRNAKHAAQWTATLVAHAYPIMGDKPVAEVAVADVLAALEPIWRTKTETASRVRGRIESVLDYGKAQGWRKGENPALWRGHLENLLPARSKVAKVEHHPALPWQEMAAFMARLRGQAGTAALALQFTILTAARSGEVFGARKGEIDWTARLWTVPGERMKAGREHRVPLGDAAMEVLERAGARNGDADDLVFAGMRPNAGLSNMSMTAVLRRMKLPDLTVHGFRSSFRDWCAEATSHPRDVAEAALAHTLSDKVEAAYRRGDMLAKRATLMADWAVFCGGEAATEGAAAVDAREHAT